MRAEFHVSAFLHQKPHVYFPQHSGHSRLPSGIPKAAIQLKPHQKLSARELAGRKKRKKKDGPDAGCLSTCFFPSFSFFF
jgi:hypothetical protein